MIWKISMYNRKESEHDESFGGKVWFVPNTVRGSGGRHNLRKIWNFYPHLSLKTVFPALELTHNCYINNKICFSSQFSNSQFNHKLGPPVSYKHTVLKDYAHNLTRHEIMGTSKIPPSKLFSELGNL